LSTSQIRELKLISYSAGKIGVDPYAVLVILLVIFFPYYGLDLGNKWSDHFIMKKTISMSLLLLLLCFNMIHAEAESYVPEGWTVIIEPPPVYSIEGNINGEINDASMVAAMTSLAKEYNLAGWIKKLPDGTMRFHLQGLQKNVKEAIAKIPQCDPGSKVSSVDTKPAYTVNKNIHDFKNIENE